VSGQIVLVSHGGGARGDSDAPQQPGKLFG